MELIVRELENKCNHETHSHQLEKKPETKKDAKEKLFQPVVYSVTKHT